MKKTLSILAAIAIIGATQMSFVTPEKLTVDVNASQLKWTGYHLAKSYEHWGYVNLKSGSITTDGNQITSGEFVMDMNTITDQDLEKAKDNTKLVNDLKSDRFFGTKEFPEAKLVIKKTEKKSGNIYNTVADLTIRGITKEINFDTTIKSISATALEATADLRVQRTDFNVMYGWSIGNAMLDGEFRMEVKIVANK